MTYEMKFVFGASPVVAVVAVVAMVAVDSATFVAACRCSHVHWAALTALLVCTVEPQGVLGAIPATLCRLLHIPATARQVMHNSEGQLAMPNLTAPTP